jgi:hypothetical protein
VIRALANSRALLGSSPTVLDNVGSGVFLAGFAVYFDALARVDRSRGTLKYVNPADATAVTPNVSSVLRSAADTKLASAFIRYCLSEAGQAVWAVKAEFRPIGGETLYHYPINPELYAKRANQLSVTENPFETEFGLKIDLDLAGRQAAALMAFVPAACGENHVLLQRAWAAVIAAEGKADALAELCAPPAAEEEAYRLAAEYRTAPPDRAKEIEAQWSAFFKQKYEKVISLAGGAAAP